MKSGTNEAAWWHAAYNGQWVLGLVLAALGPLIQAPAWAAEPIAATPAGRLDRTNLLVYRDNQGQAVPVKSAAEWAKRRAEIIRGMESVMEPLPGKEKRCPLEVKIESEEDCGSHLRRMITYASEPGSRVPAYLLIPKSVLDGKRTAPAVLALHPTDMKYGNKVLVVQANTAYRVYGTELVERGFVVLAPAYPIMASYNPDLTALGYQSGTMKAIWDNIRGLDLLESLPYVKQAGFGVLGHSLGGHNSIYTAVFDERIKVIVSSCGFDSYLDYYGGNPKVWQAGQGWCQTRYMPKLAEYRGRLEEIPFDFPEMIGALAPRPCFINAPLKDSNFKWESVDRVVAAARPIYQLLGKPENLRVEHPDCPHDFPTEMRELAYQLLERELGK